MRRAAVQGNSASLDCIDQWRQIMSKCRVPRLPPRTPEIKPTLERKNASARFSQGIRRFASLAFKFKRSCRRQSREGLDRVSVSGVGIKQRSAGIRHRAMAFQQRIAIT